MKAELSWLYLVIFLAEFVPGAGVDHGLNAEADEAITAGNQNNLINKFIRFVGDNSQRQSRLMNF